MLFTTSIINFSVVSIILIPLINQKRAHSASMEFELPPPSLGLK